MFDVVISVRATGNKLPTTPPPSSTYRPLPQGAQMLLDVNTRCTLSYQGRPAVPRRWSKSSSGVKAAKASGEAPPPCADACAPPPGPPPPCTFSSDLPSALSQVGRRQAIAAHVAVPLGRAWVGRMGGRGARDMPHARMHTQAYFKRGSCR